MTMCLNFALINSINRCKKILTNVLVARVSITHRLTSFLLLFEIYNPKLNHNDSVQKRFLYFSLIILQDYDEINLYD